MASKDVNELIDDQYQGYNDERFESTVDQEFHCTICHDVLKEPLQCQRNEHHFCMCCITRHIQQTSKTCPLCMEELSLETLRTPSRIVMNVLSKLKINCDYAPRGCGDVVELGVLKTHVANCEFSPVLCSINGCLVTINKRDKLHHETNVCEFRKVKCDDCGEEMIHKKYSTHGCVLKKKVDEVAGKLEIVKEEIMKDIRDMMKDMRDTMADMKEEILKKLAKQATVGIPREDIIVAGGCDRISWLNSAERFSWSTRAWVALPPMKQPRSHSSSFVYENQIIVNGGHNGSSGTDTMEKIDMDQEPKQWLDFPAKLPFKCNGHTSVIYQDRLITTGGYNVYKGEYSDGIYEVLLTPPYTSRFRRLLSRMPAPRYKHRAEIFGNQIWIVGGTTTGNYKGSVNNVIMYDINTNQCKEMPGLPYAVSHMASVSWEDNVIIMGGQNTNGDALQTVIKYNIKTGMSEMLPQMKHKRYGCTAIFTGNVIIVMGGHDGKVPINSVECYSFDQYSWGDLPPLIGPRQYATAVAI